MTGVMEFKLIPVERKPKRGKMKGILVHCRRCGKEWHWKSTVYDHVPVWPINCHSCYAWRTIYPVKRVMVDES